MTNTRVVSVSIEMNCGHSLYSAPWSLYVVTVLNTITGIETTLTCEALFNATGRVPNVRHLELDQVNIQFPYHPLSVSRLASLSINIEEFTLMTTLKLRIQISILAETVPLNINSPMLLTFKQGLLYEICS